MKLAEGTIVGTIYLDLQVMDHVQEQISNIASKAQGTVKDTVANTGKATAEAAAKAVKTPLEKARQEMSKIEDDLDAIAKRAAKKYADSLSPKGVKLPVSTPKTGSKLASQMVEAPEEKDSAKPNAGRAPPAPSFQPALNAAELLQQKLDVLSSKMGEHVQRLGQLEVEYEQVATAQGNTSAAAEKLNRAITAEQSAMISLQQSINATQGKIEAPFRRAEAAAKRSQEKIAAAAQKAAAKQAAAANQAANAQIKASGRVTQTVTAAQAKQTKAYKSTARAQANAFLSAASSQAKGVAQIGVMGRTALTSLRGLATALPMAAALGAFKLLQAGFRRASEQSEQFQSSLNALKANLQIAFTPIYNAILPALNTLVSALASAARQFAAFISAVFGTTYSESVEATKKMQANANKVGSAATKAANKYRRSLASFDQINRLESPDKDSGGGGSGDTGIDYNNIGTGDVSGAEKLGESVKAFIEKVKSYIPQSIFDSFDQSIEKLKTAFKNLFNVPGLSDFLAKVAAFFSGNIIGNIGNLALGLSGLLDIFRGIFTLDPIAFLNGVKDLFVGLQSIPIDFITRLIDSIFGTNFYEIWQKIKQAFMNIDFGEVWDNIKTAASICWQKVQETFSKAGEWFNSNVIRPIGEFFSGLWQGIVDTFNGVKDWFYEKFLAAKNAVSNAWSSVKDFFSGIWTGIQNAFSSVGSWFSDIFSGAKTAVENAFSGVKTFFEGIWTGISNGARGAVNFVVGFLNKAINGINGLISGLNTIHFDLPDWVPFGLGGKSFGINIPKIPEIPYLAKGGLVDQPTLAMIGDNPGARNDPEVVSPLSKLKGMLDTEESGTLRAILLEILKILKELREKNNSQGDITIPIYLGNDLLDEIILKAQGRRLVRSNGKG